MPAGRLSRTITFDAVDGPMFVAVMVKFVEPPLVKAGIVGQLMTLFENEPLDDALLKFRPAGKLSFTTMFDAVEGPPLVTTMV